MPDVFEKKHMGRLGNVTMSEAVDFEECDVLMSVQTEHAYEVGVFFIASVQFHFTVAGYDKHRGCVTSYI